MIFNDDGKVFSNNFLVSQKCFLGEHLTISNPVNCTKEILNLFFKPPKIWLCNNVTSTQLKKVQSHSLPSFSDGGNESWHPLSNLADDTNEVLFFGVTLSSLIIPILLIMVKMLKLWRNFCPTTLECGDSLK